MTDSADDRTLPPDVEHLLSHWQLPERREADWEAMAAAIESRVAKLEPGAGEGEEWLFQPPLPLGVGEPRRFTTDESAKAETPSAETAKTEAAKAEINSARVSEHRVRASDHRSLKEIAQETLRAQPHQQHLAPARAPAQSGVQLSPKANLDPSANLGAKAKAPAKLPTPVVLPKAAMRPRGEVRLVPPPGSGKAPERGAFPVLAARPELPAPSALTAQSGLTEHDHERPAPTKAVARWGWGALIAAAAIVALLLGREGPQVASLEGEMSPPAEVYEVAASAWAPTNPGAAAEVDTEKVETKKGDTEKADTERANTSEPVPTLTPEALEAPPAETPTRPLRPSTQQPEPHTKPSVVAEAQRAPKQDQEPVMVPAAELGGRPARPSTGAALAAIGPALGAARICVVGHLTPSYATVTFGSDGRVRSVSVSGTAAGTPAEGCIQRAMMRSRVSPFSDPSFSVKTTVRP